MNAQEKTMRLEQDVQFTEFQFQNMDNYAWDDANINTAKVYLTKDMDGIKQLDPTCIQCEFEAQSIDLKIREFNGKNYRFRIDPLMDSIAVEKCTMNIKSNSITLTLKKENPRAWRSLKWTKPIKSNETHMPAMSKAAHGGEKETLNSLMSELYKDGSTEIK